ncbi:MAG: hypothetical protein U0P46_09205 [Holophagaceae bacterium]
MFMESTAPDLTKPRLTLLALIPVFFLSGASGLLFETLWLYQAGLALGNSTWAVAVVLSAFMGGLALGNLGAMLRWTRPSNPVRTYALLEGIIALSGPLLVLLLPGVGRVVAPLLGPWVDVPGFLNPIRFLAAFVLLLVPSAAMGYTLPVLTEALTAELPDFRKALGRLYGWNTLGAVAGALVGEVFCIKHLGILGTALGAALLNLLAAGLALYISRSWEARSMAPAVAWRGLFPQGMVPWWCAVALGGAALLGLEAIWMRFLSLFVRVTSLAFTTMLALVLSGIALGGLFASRLPARMAWVHRKVSLIPFLAGAACALSYTLFPLYHRAFEAREIYRFVDVAILATPLMLPVSFLSGAFFTLAGSGFRDHYPSSQAATGALTLFNTFGAALGAPLITFLAIPHLGMERSLFLLALVYGIIALLWWWRANEGPIALALGAGLWLLSLAFFPFGSMTSRHLPLAVARWAPSAETRIVSVKEGINETVVHLESRVFGQRAAVRMITNSFSMSGNNIAGRRYMKAFVYWPMAFHPDPRKALLICYGVGQTAKAFTDFPQLETIDVVDISRDILQLSDLVYPDPKEHPLKDRRVRVHVEDGRFFLQATPERYDIISGEPPPPMVPGVASLYSRQYFQLLHDRLREGGMATYWLPINQMGEPVACSIIKAFADVFPDCYLWHGSQNDLVLVGIRGQSSTPSMAQFTRAWQDPKVLTELANLGFETPAQFLSGFIGDGPYLRDLTRNSPPLVDDFPKRIVGEPQKDAPLFLNWFDPVACRERFLASESMKRLVPGDWFERSLSHFDLQPLLVSMGHSNRTGDFPYFPPLLPLLTKSQLRTPIMWALGSNEDIQRALQAAPPALQESPEGRFHTGIRQLSERNVQGAFDNLKAASRDPKFRRVSVATCAFILCLTGQQGEAEGYLSRQADFKEVRSIPPEFWGWLEGSFRLRVPPRLKEPTS